MKATDILYEEHRIIVNVLQCLEKIVEEAEQKGKLNEASATTAIHFLRNFADRCHHAKEEDRLFVVLEQSGIPREGGPLGVMLMEHDFGRKHVKAMAESVSKAAQGDQDALHEFTENAGGLIALLRSHIDKEDQVLFPMAVQTLNEGVKDTLYLDFKKIEAEAGGNRHSEYIKIARQLCEQYGVHFVNESQIRTIMTEFNVS
jgi:hemerythrin-like domain-containing protein